MIEIPILERGNYLAFKFNNLIDVASSDGNYEGRNDLAKKIFNSVIEELRRIRDETMREFGEKDFEGYQIVPSKVRTPNQDLFEDIVLLYNQKVKQYLFNKVVRNKRD